ncbi:MAG: acyl-ACP thioesterase [Spirochaetaceae bacterium]|nr:acyl-ACP thioesterase [Spirochaetaceae bacterium]
MDRSDRLTLAAVFDVFQELAISHAEELGVGRDALAASRQGWILSRMAVVIDSRPKWGETVIVRSWPRGADRLFAVRDYDIQDRDGQVLVRSRSDWIILDLDRRRPLRVHPVVEKFPQNDGLDALPGVPPGLEARENLEKAGERRAAYSDIDYNGHVNNARYIPWIQDLGDAETLEKADRIRLDINYLNEIRYGELIELWAAGIDTADPKAASVSEGNYSRAIAFEGRRAADSQPMFRAELRTGSVSLHSN